MKPVIRSRVSRAGLRRRVLPRQSRPVEVAQLPTTPIRTKLRHLERHSGGLQSPHPRSVVRVHDYERCAHVLTGCSVDDRHSPRVHDSLDERTDFVVVTGLGRSDHHEHRDLAGQREHDAFGAQARGAPAGESHGGCGRDLPASGYASGFETFAAAVRARQEIEGCRAQAGLRPDDLGAGPVGAYQSDDLRQRSLLP
jgi:hypothetical protein